MSTCDVELKRWEKIVLEWLGDKTFDATFKTKWVIEPLTHRLFERGVIPELVSHDATLYEILVLQMEKQLLLSLQVPQAIQGPFFTYKMNVQEMRLHTLCCEIQKKKEAFESEMGVNLDHYHKIVESGKRCRSSEPVLKSNETRRKLHKKGFYCLTFIHQYYV
jgi:hypothetical protein